MLPFILFSTLLSPIFTESEKQQWICNSSDAIISYSYCDHMKFPVSISSEPCIRLQGTSGFVHLEFIPNSGMPHPQVLAGDDLHRGNLKNLYLNLFINVNSVELPKRKEVVCHGYDDDYSFCRALKGETVNTSIPFSFKGILFSKRMSLTIFEASLEFTVIFLPSLTVCWNYKLVSPCLVMILLLVFTSGQGSLCSPGTHSVDHSDLEFTEIHLPQAQARRLGFFLNLEGHYRCVAEAIAGDTEEKLFCLNFTIIHPRNIN